MPKIFVVEDDNILSKAIVTSLESEGYEVVLATDGQEAMDKLPESNADLIFLDLILPRKSGEEVLGEIRKDARLKDIPVLISTVKFDTESISRCEAMGIDGYLIKAHYTLAEISSEIKKTLLKHAKLAKK